jgi:hypothetical protein
MLCWICPDCGRDCSPAVQECPFCAQQQQQAKVSTEVLAMVESLRNVPSVPLLASAPEQYLLFGLTNGDAVVTKGTAVLLETVRPPEIAQRVEAHLASLSAAQPALSSTRPLAAPAPIEKPTPPPTPSLKFVELPVSPAPQIRRAAPLETSQPMVAEPLAASPKTEPPAPVAHVAEPSIPLLPTPKSTPAVLRPPAVHPVPAAKFVELPAPPALPVRVAPLLETVTPAAAHPPASAPLNHAEPTAFRAHEIELQKLDTRAAFPLKTAPRVDVPNSAPKTPVPLRPPLAETRSFGASAPRIAKMRVRAQFSTMTAPLAALNMLPGVPASVASPAPIRYNAQFAAPVARLPKLQPVRESLLAAADLLLGAGVFSEALKLYTESILDEIDARVLAYESGIRAIAAQFEARPIFALLAAPGKVVAAPAPPDLQLLKLRPSFSSRKPSDMQCEGLTVPAQKMPLAGPCLPRELQNFIQEPFVAQPRRSRKMGPATLAVSFLLATGLFLGAASGLQYFAYSRDAKAATVPVTPGQPAAAPVAPAFEQHPFARFLEVTGLRVVTDPNHRPQVQYIVVNHSATPLTGMLIKIAVRSSTQAAGAAPLFTVSAVVPSLAPHQSKEIRTDLDSELRSSAIPDWEYLRTEVQVGSQN